MHMIKHEFHYNRILSYLYDFVTEFNNVNLSNVNAVLISDKIEFQKYANR